MRVRLVMAAGVLALLTGLANARERQTASKRYFLDRDGGGIEVRVNDSKDTETLDAVQTELQQAAADHNGLSTPEMEQHQEEIKYRYEETNRGGRVRITSRNGRALRAIQDFLRSQINEAKTSKTVTFSFVRNTSLVVVPVMVNDQGPFRFLLDTGASNTILSKKVAGRLKLNGGKPRLLSTAAGEIEVTLRNIRTLKVGDAGLKELEIAVTDFELLQELQVDGILGGDYLRRFKVFIDYEKQTVLFEGGRESSLLLA